MFKFTVGEDTFTPWVDKKLEEAEAFQISLLTQLANIFLTEHTDPYVPVVSGSLKESAHYMWSWDSGLSATGLSLVWTGIFNSSHEEFVSFDNEFHEDYALSVYEGFHYSTGDDSSSDHWVEQGLWSFDSEINGILEEEFLKWLFT